MFLMILHLMILHLHRDLLIVVVAVKVVAKAQGLPRHPRAGPAGDLILRDVLPDALQDAL